MGLDMYGFSTPFRPEKPVDFKLPGEDEDRFADSELLHKWRKHPNLHGWMENLYRAKGGRWGDFNCTKLLLTDGDLDALEAALNEKSLPITARVFFGKSYGTKEELDDDLEFVAKARAALADGLTVYYTPWW